MTKTNDVTAIFPNLTNFAQSNLGFLKS